MKPLDAFRMRLAGLFALGAALLWNPYAYAADPAGPSNLAPGQPQAVSTNYTHDGAAGSALSSVAVSASYANRAGFAGQLYEVVGVTVTSAETDVDEAGSLQLVATASLDDGTILELSPTLVSWSALSGPLAGISETGLATAANVYQDTAAVARGEYAGVAGTLGFSVVNLGLDDFGIYAGDALPDAWQVTFFGVNNPDAAPHIDADHDGQINRFEFIASTSPSDNSSQLRHRLEPVAGEPAKKRFVFSPYDPARTYRLEWTTQLGNSTSWFPVTIDSEGDQAGERFMVDGDATQSRKFYRLRIDE